MMFNNKPSLKGVSVMFKTVAGVLVVSTVLFAVASRSKAEVMCNNLLTIAGTGTYGWYGDANPAKDAQFRLPTGIAVGSDGKIYIADTNTHIIRMVTPSNGLIQTFAGVPETPGNAGEAIAATSATLNFPKGVAVDGLGRIYIADTANNAIRRVDTGFIYRYAGTIGTPNYGGDGLPRLSASSWLRRPTAVHVINNTGDIFIVDTGNNAIRKVESEVLSTVAGGNSMAGTAGFKGDGGPATAALLNEPTDVTYNPATSCLYIADNNNHRIRKVDASGIISTVAGNGSVGYSGDWGPAPAATFSKSITGISIDSVGNLYVADTGNTVVRMIKTDGTILTIAGSTAGFAGDGGPARDGKFRNPWGLEADASGTLYIADAYDNRIRKVIGSTLGMDGALSARPAAPRAGDTVELVLTVTNTGSCDIISVTPYLDTNVGVANTTLGTSPNWASSVAFGASRKFTWTVSLTGGAGTVSFTASAMGNLAMTAASVSLTVGPRPPVPVIIIPLDPLLYVPGKATIAPNSFGIDDPAGKVIIRLRGDAGGAVTLKVYDSAGRYMGSYTATLLANGTQIVNYDRDGWENFKPAPGAYWMVASGGGVKDKQRLFIRRKQ